MLSQPPNRLQRGDVVEAKIRKEKTRWTVKDTYDSPEGQVVVASEHGRGAVRFTWSNGIGIGHGLEFRFIRRDPLDVERESLWRHANGAIYRVMFLTNQHHADDRHLPDVVYESADFPDRKWSRPLSTWHDTFTRV